VPCSCGLFEVVDEETMIIVVGFVGSVCYIFKKVATERFPLCGKTSHSHYIPLIPRGSLLEHVQPRAGSGAVSK